MAIAGLATGYFGLICFAAFLLGLALPIIGAVQDRGRAVKSVAQAHEIAHAINQYAADHEGAFPARLTDLIPKYLPGQGSLACPLSSAGTQSGYRYFPGKDADQPDHILLTSETLTRRHERVVAYGDGRTVLLRE